ncbi:release factor glutamine methyltransferase [Cellvibrio zantedeschiae]|uniref:Release factor glutamine methyltransferase n=1 Tax=Cellvibrio zantedeschiae TaxID=1237077 RepID=A0ABQ3B9M6_9GAMM|nr:peptide chain release factor N(5)-glutamine methyltransferase [Cellvibrio zantedeschiae]GGY79901.1 release factor glutamine methyltransferase [Cellvibrio zantedeschiae]
MNLLTIADCLKKSSQLLNVSDSPRLDIELLLTHILQKDRTYLFTWPEKQLTEQEVNQFNDFFARRLTGEPVAHIMGQREFWSLPLMVNSSTLIPRPDTELLVEATLGLFAEDETKQSRRLLDLGTGTGAIVLALANEKPSWQCVGVDKEIAAVELAEKNRLQLKLDNVKIQQSNWFAALESEAPFDVIVSNPPYIDPQDEHLTQGDVRFEPLSALIADNKGLADLELIIAQAPKFLTANGWLLVEHGYDQGEAVRNLFEHNHFDQINTFRDFGRNERVTIGQRKSI